MVFACAGCGTETKTQGSPSEGSRLVEPRSSATSRAGEAPERAAAVIGTGVAASTERADDATISVKLLLDDAVAQALDWGNPDGDPRILRRRTVGREGLAAAFRDEGAYLLGGRLGALDAGVVDGAALDRLVEGPVHLVEVAQRGMDVWTAEQEGVEPRAALCFPVDAGTTYTQTMLFDAGAGDYLGALHDDAPAALWRAAEVPAKALVPVTATPEPRTSATEPPSPVAPETVRGADALPTLAPGTLPTAILPLAETLPWVPGARWTYRVTGVGDGMRWWRYEVTETLSSARALTPELVEARLRRNDRDAALHVSAPSSPWGRLGERFYLTPSRLAAVTSGAGEEVWTPASLATAIAYAADAPRGEHGLFGPIQDVLRLPLAEGSLGYVWSLSPAGTVETPAGRFEGCWELYEQYSARTGFTHWLCPGVGFVRHERWGCSSARGSAEVYELVDWQVPTAVPVPR